MANDKESEDDKKTQSSETCENCGGTGRTKRDAKVKDESGKPVSYENGTCPVCGGSGRKPAAAIPPDHKRKFCYVATVAFGDPQCNEVLALRQFRDQRLAPNLLGRAFIRIYYATGPTLASFVATRPRLKRFLKQALQSLCAKLPRSH